jgi:replicative DNA helicase
VAEVIVAKNRTGPTKTVEVAFFRDHMRFESLSYLYSQKVMA